MTVDENKALARRLIEEVVSTGDLSRADEVIAPDFVEHNPAPGQGPGIAGFRQVVGMLHAAFPDLEVTPDEIIAEGDKVAMRLTVRGTHRGPFVGVPPTGRAAEWQGISMLRVAGGRIAERWFYFDMPGLMRQLGAGPPPP